MDGAYGANKRRFRKSFKAGASAGPGQWLQRHPLAAAALHMLIGGGIVYLLLTSSHYRKQRQLDGIVRLAATTPAPVNPAPPAPDTFTASQAAANQPLCQDTCFKANDGVCDDGRFLPNMTRGLPSQVLCDLGTDCSDCGPWKGVQHSSSWQESVGPVEYLRQHNLTLLTKRSALEPRFYMGFTDPAHDTDLSKHFAALSTVELRLSHIAYHVLHAPCQKGADYRVRSNNGSGAGSSSANSNSSGQEQGLQGEEQVAEGLMLDVGANFGWYSLMAGMLGCRVIAWEPVKTFQAYLEYGIARNKLQHKVEVRAAALLLPTAPNSSSTDGSTRSSPPQQLLSPRLESRRWRPWKHRKQQQQQQEEEEEQQEQEQQQEQEPPHANVTVVAPQRGIWGTASIGGRNIDTSIDNGRDYHKFHVPVESLDEVIMPLFSKPGYQSDPKRHSHVALLKVDVEGHEPDVIAGAGRLLGKQLIDNILLEYSPHVTERHNITQLSQYPHMLLQLLKNGFKLGHVAQHNYGHRLLSTFSEPLHQLQAITETNLKFDLLDCMQMTEVGHMWLHQPCREMVAYGLIREGLPEQLHPKSFRSTFEANTNVWASRQHRYMPYLQGPQVGIFPAKRNLTDSWFIPDGANIGLGGRTCSNLREVAANEGLTHGARAALLISHRCRCNTTGVGSCAEEEQLADACAQAGKTPFMDDPDYVPE